MQKGAPLSYGGGLSLRRHADMQPRMHARVNRLSLTMACGRQLQSRAFTLPLFSLALHDANAKCKNKSRTHILWT